MDYKKPALVFQLWEGDSGIFLEEETYLRLKAIRTALETARTWGRYEKLCPEGEFAALPLWHQNGGEYVYEVDGEPHFIGPEEFPDFLENSGRAYVIKPGKRFDSRIIPGVDDGDYPPWLDSTAEDILPGEFVETFADLVDGAPASGGTWTEYDASEVDEMVSWLEARGFSVTVHLDYD